MISMKQQPIFISYASQDRNAAEHVLSFLETRGIGCWIAPRDIPPAADWAESIIDGIDSAFSMILLLSRYSNESPQVRREVERAVSNGLMIYPLVLDEVDLSKWMQYYISAHQWYDASDVPLNRRLGELLGAIRDQLGKDVTRDDVSDLSMMLEKDLTALSTALEVESNQQERLLPDERRMITVLGIKTEISGIENGSSVKGIVSRTVVNLIERYSEFYGGYFYNRYSNDYLCLFGLEHVLEDDSRRALECGESLLQALSRVSSTLRSRKISLEFGLGLSSGMIDVNETDEEDPEPHYGEALDTAKELAENASMELLATKTVFNALKDECSWEKHSEVVYRFSRRSSSIPGMRTCSVRTPFVGREKELAQLISLLEMQNTGTEGNGLCGSRHIIQGICGEAGIGKSRLVHEFIEENCPEDEYLVMRGQTLSFAQPPFWLWTTLLRGLLGIEYGSNITYMEFLEALKIFGEDPALTDSAPFLAELLSIGSGDDRLEILDRRAVKLETAIAFRNLLNVLAERNRVLVVLEDLHWIEISDLEILEFMCGNLNTSHPVIFLLLHRPDHKDGSTFQLDLPSNCRIIDEIELKEVDEESSKDLVRQLIGCLSDQGARLIDLDAERYLIDRSRGNPFYLEELVLDLIESGTLIERENEWRFSTSISEIFVPDTLTGLLQSRIDRLPESWRGVLQHSSVLGVEFQLKLYRRLAEKLFLGRAQSEVFDGLERKQLLLSSHNSFDRKYTFRHILLHDTAYSSIHEINLKLLHKAAAESIEELQPNESDRISGILMHHYEKAEQYHKAIKWGFVALKHYMGEEALKLSYRLERLLEEQRDQEQHIDRLYELLSTREQVQDVLGEREGQLATIRRMMKLAEESGSDYMMAVALKKNGALARVTGSIDRARKDLEGALELTRKAANRAFEGIVLGNLGALDTNQGRLDEARAYYEQALIIHREAGDLRSEGIILGNLGIICKNLDSTEEAREYYDKALRIAYEVGDRRSSADVLSNIGSLLWHQGRLDEAGEYYERSIARQKEIGNRRSTGIIQANLGILRMSQGRMEEAKTHYNRALEIVRDTGDRYMEGHILGNLGVMYAEQDEIGIAFDHYEKALKIHREAGNRTSEGIVLGNLGNNLYLQGRLQEAREQYELALAADREVRNRRDEGNVLTNLGCLLSDLDHPEEALDCYRKAIAIISDMNLDRNAIDRMEELRGKLIGTGYTSEHLPLPDNWEASENE